MFQIGRVKAMGTGTVKGGAYVRIDMNYPRLMPTEKRVADIIIKNSHHIDTLSISSIAQEAGSSKAAVTRFCKRLGYNGFKDFRVSAIKDTHAGLNKGAALSQELGNDDESLVNGVCHSNAQACRDTALLLDVEALGQAVAAVLASSRILFVGEGAVAAVLMDLYQKLLRVGLMGVYTQDQRLQRMQISLAGPGDVVVAVDLTGSKRTTVEMAQQAHKNGAKVITICNAIGSELAKWGTVNLFGPGRMGSQVSATLAPRVALLCIVDCLFTLLETRMGEQGADGICKTNDVIVNDWVE